MLPVRNPRNEAYPSIPDAAVPKHCLLARGLSDTRPQLTPRVSTQTTRHKTGKEKEDIVEGEENTSGSSRINRRGIMAWSQFLFWDTADGRLCTLRLWARSMINSLQILFPDYGMLAPKCPPTPNQQIAKPRSQLLKVSLSGVVGGRSAADKTQYCHGSLRCAVTNQQPECPP